MSSEHFPAYLKLLRPAFEAIESNPAAPLRFERAVDQDKLCGVGTRHALIQRLETLAGLSPSAPLSFVLVKVHGLAEINRVEGFQAGDTVLRDLAAKVKTFVRATDMVGRFTSSSFGVVLQGSGATAAAAVAERLEHFLTASVTAPTSVTISVATGRGSSATTLPLAAVDSLTGAG